MPSQRSVVRIVIEEQTGSASGRSDCFRKIGELPAKT
jgi:hypothetical protein